MTIGRLVQSGFCFFAELSGGKIILENKYTGLRILWDDETQTYTVL